MVLSTTRRFLVAGIVAAGWFASLALAQMPTMELSAGIHLIRAEVAHTFETRAQGLMYRRSLGPNEGMLFVFPRAEVQCMWMKNTLVPLSVAFMDEAGKIISISDMQPQTETPHCAAAPAKFALEMSRGWFSAKGVKAGASIVGVEKAPPAR
jgi:uncharacterized membrane protein (UPF0127 family)